MELSILVATVSSRASLLSRLLNNLDYQLQAHDPSQVEVIVHRSDTKPMGQKFSELYRAANGILSVQVDDDDQVAANYITRILDVSKGHDFIGYKVMVTNNGSLRDKAVYEINPQKRRDHPPYGSDTERIRVLTPKCPLLTARARMFPFLNFVGADWFWVEDVIRDGFPFNPVFINRELYHYDCWPDHTLGTKPEEWTEQRQVETMGYDKRQFTWIE